jgi:hypothetical protein
VAVLIVATGNIFEDIVQARAAAEQGADIVAVIRSTGQSLLDYVPYGATTEGFGGTYATQENFRLMRAALDEVGDKLQRYIRLTNYCSGLCMPEIAAMGAMERLDMMLNDAMYGIIFRDINMQRTFIDQFFSRMVNAYAGIIINTGEDNYLTTADAVEAAHTVLASQLINEQFACCRAWQPAQMGLGHAFEINPGVENGFLWELAHAQLVRQVFPDASLKYMPPTKHMTGNIFKGHVQDALFNIVSTAHQPEHPPAGHDDRGHPHALHPGPFPVHPERASTCSTPCVTCTAKSNSSPVARSNNVRRPCWPRPTPCWPKWRARACRRPSRRAALPTSRASPTAARAWTAWWPRRPTTYNPFAELMLPGVH